MAVRVFLVEGTKPMQELIGGPLESVGGYDLAEGSGFTLISRCNKDADGSGAIEVFSDFVSPALQQRCKRLGADKVISKAHFAQLRSYLQPFLGRRPEPVAA
jgi:hypothetical protein